MSLENKVKGLSRV